MHKVIFAKKRSFLHKGPYYLQESKKINKITKEKKNMNFYKVTTKVRVRGNSDSGKIAKKKQNEE